MKPIIFFISFSFILSLSVPIFAVEIEPHITDREIVEKLVGLETGQTALNQRMTDLRSEMNQRFVSLESQYDRIWNLILVVLAGIMGLIGFIIWDRKTASQPLEKKIIELENNLSRDLELRHEQGSLPIRLLYTLRKLAENDSELSAILRSFSLL